MSHVTRSCNEPFMIIYQSRYENLSKVELHLAICVLMFSHILIAQQNFFRFIGADQAQIETIAANAFLTLWKA